MLSSVDVCKIGCYPANSFVLFSSTWLCLACVSVDTQVGICASVGAVGTALAVSQGPSLTFALTYSVPGSCH